jgi:hypothetical protein
VRLSWANLERAATLERVQQEKRPRLKQPISANEDLQVMIDALSAAGFAIGGGSRRVRVTFPLAPQESSAPLPLTVSYFVICSAKAFPTTIRVPRRGPWGHERTLTASSSRQRRSMVAICDECHAKCHLSDDDTPWRIELCSLTKFFSCKIWYLISRTVSEDNAQAAT